MIAVVVLTYDARPGMLEACLAALREHSGSDVVVTLVDNGQNARGLDASSRRGVEVVETGRNLGFAGGMNVGIRRALSAGAVAVFVMNDDVVVQPGWLEPLLAELDIDPRVGAVQPKLVFPDQPPTVNSLGVQLGRDGAGTDIAMGVLDSAARTDAHDIELFTGGAVLLRSAFLDDVGLFDERFFMYYEDVDLGLRGHQRGWRYRCVPRSTVVHEGGATVARAGHSGAFHRERNRVWILLRYRPAGDALRGLWLSVRRLRWRPRLVHARALAAGLVAAPRLLLARRRQA
ncbi:MAG: glycosyltransferase family 2 protein [Actinobacteria bacterium]|nr:glycosyltransferase family 2 protein [Actinomycetota bacterium]